ncbi:unnamed protein product [Paramecium pentaurelia]|uniref:Uncharacterized protein n=1 Tax=Paramecium pentaurelia TaxID=43138 RepID=A0A8S1WGT7_9CILI|nr:unnamed protein product [Paramecium pentaurelia]
MGGGQSKAQKLQSQRRANKPQLPQHQTPEQHYQFLISEPISRYLWNTQFDYENLISEILFSISIKRCMDYLQYFKPHMRYIKKAEKLYNDVTQCCLYESKFNDQDKKIMIGVLILFFSLYHISKFQVIFSSSDKKWWEGTYFVSLQKYVELPPKKNESYIQTFALFMSDYFQSRFHELKPQNDNKKVDLVSVRVLADYYLQFLYSDSISYLTDSDQFVKDYAQIKQPNYQTYGRYKLESNIKIMSKKQKQQQQLLYQQQLQDSKTPSQQIEDMEKQFKFLSDHSLIENSIIQDKNKEQVQIVQETQKLE